MTSINPNEEDTTIRAVTHGAETYTGNAPQDITPGAQPRRPGDITPPVEVSRGPRPAPTYTLAGTDLLKNVDASKLTGIDYAALQGQQIGLNQAVNTLNAVLGTSPETARSWLDEQIYWATWAVARGSGPDLGLFQSQLDLYRFLEANLPAGGVPSQAAVQDLLTRAQPAIFSMISASAGSYAALAARSQAYQAAAPEIQAQRREAIADYESALTTATIQANSRDNPQEAAAALYALNTYLASPAIYEAAKGAGVEWKPGTTLFSVKVEGGYAPIPAGNVDTSKIITDFAAFSAGMTPLAEAMVIGPGDRAVSVWGSPGVVAPPRSSRGPSFPEFEAINVPGTRAVYSPWGEREPGARYSADELMFGKIINRQRIPYGKEGTYHPEILNPDYTVWESDYGAWLKVMKFGNVRAGGSAASWGWLMDQQAGVSTGAILPFSTEYWSLPDKVRSSYAASMLAESAGQGWGSAPVAQAVRDLKLEYRGLETVSIKTTTQEWEMLPDVLKDASEFFRTTPILGTIFGAGAAFAGMTGMRVTLPTQKMITETRETRVFIPPEISTKISTQVTPNALGGLTTETRTEVWTIDKSYTQTEVSMRPATPPLSVESMFTYPWYEILHGAGESWKKSVSDPFTQFVMAPFETGKVNLQAEGPLGASAILWQWSARAAVGFVEIPATAAEFAGMIPPGTERLIRMSVVESPTAGHEISINPLPALGLIGGGLAMQGTSLVEGITTDPARTAASLAGMYLVFEGLRGGVNLGISRLSTIGDTEIPIEKVGYPPEMGYAKGQYTVSSLRESFARGTHIPFPSEMSETLEPPSYVPEMARVPGVSTGVSDTGAVVGEMKPTMWTAWEGTLETILKTGITKQVDATWSNSEIQAMYGDPTLQSYFAKVGGQAPEGIGFNIINRPFATMTEVEAVETFPRGVSTYEAMDQFLQSTPQEGIARMPFTKPEYEAVIYGTIGVERTGFYTSVGGIELFGRNFLQTRLPIYRGVPIIEDIGGEGLVGAARPSYYGAGYLTNAPSLGVAAEVTSLAQIRTVSTGESGVSSSRLLDRSRSSLVGYTSRARSPAPSSTLGESRLSGLERASSLGVSGRSTYDEPSVESYARSSLSSSLVGSSLSSSKSLASSRVGSSLAGSSSSSRGGTSYGGSSTGGSSWGGSSRGGSSRGGSSQGGSSRGGSSRGGSSYGGGSSGWGRVAHLPRPEVGGRRRRPWEIIGYGELVHPIVEGSVFLGLKKQGPLPPVREWHLSRVVGAAPPSVERIVARSRAMAPMVHVHGKPRWTPGMTLGMVFPRRFWKKGPGKV
jgi:hypothetical protein